VLAMRAAYDQRGMAGSTMAGLLGGGEPQAPAGRDIRSSNAWANGNDQNCGNYITDRPTTRLHAAPGGNSQMASMLAWDTSGDQPERRTNPRSPFKKQERDHVAGKIGAGAYAAVGGSAPSEPPRTGTGYATAPDWQGSPNRTSQAAGLRPDPRDAPWGFPSMDGMCPDPRHPQRYPMDVDRTEAMSGRGNEVFQADGRSPSGHGPGVLPPGDMPSSNAFACGHNQNSGNMITDRRITKINAPPGGHSSITFG